MSRYFGGPKEKLQQIMQLSASGSEVLLWTVQAAEEHLEKIFWDSSAIAPGIFPSETPERFSVKALLSMSTLDFFTAHRETKALL